MDDVVEEAVALPLGFFYFWLLNEGDLHSFPSQIHRYVVFKAFHQIHDR